MPIDVPSISDIKDAVEDVVKDRVDRVERRTNIIREDVESVMKDVKETLEKLENVKDSVQDFGEGLGQQVLETGKGLGKGVADMGESIGKGVLDLGDKLSNPHDLNQFNEFRSLIDTCTSFASGTQGTIKSVARKNFSDIEGLFKAPQGSASGGQSRILRDVGGVTEAFSGKLNDLAQSVDWVDGLKVDPELGGIATTLSDACNSVLDEGPFGRLGKDQIPLEVPDPVINAFENIGAMAQLDHVLDRIIPADPDKKGLIDLAIDKLKPLGEKIPEFMNQKEFIQELISNPPDSFTTQGQSLSAASNPGGVKIAIGVVAGVAGVVKLVADVTIGVLDIIIQTVDYFFAASNFGASSVPCNLSVGAGAGATVGLGMLSIVPAVWAVVYMIAVILNWLVVMIREFVSIVANMCLSILNIAIAVLGVFE